MSEKRVTIRVKPGGFWDQFWSTVRSQPTLAWKLDHVTVKRNDIRAVLTAAGPFVPGSLEAQAAIRLRDAADIDYQPSNIPWTRQTDPLPSKLPPGRRDPKESTR